MNDIWLTNFDIYLVAFLNSNLYNKMLFEVIKKMTFVTLKRWHWSGYPYAFHTHPIDSNSFSFSFVYKVVVIIMLNVHFISSHSWCCIRNAHHHTGVRSSLLQQSNLKNMSQLNYRHTTFAFKLNYYINWSVILLNCNGTPYVIWL